MTTGCEALDAPGSPGARPNAAAIGRRPGRTGGRAIGRIADTVALEGAMERWGDTVLRLAVSRMGNAADAEDVFQTVFMKLLKSKSRIDDEEHLKAWLIRVTINCSYDELRKRKPTSALHETSVVFEDEEPRLSKTSLEKAIDSLVPPIRRTVIHLYYYEGYSTEEIAGITGEKPSTVRSHLHRARNALRISLEGAGDE